MISREAAARFTRAAVGLRKRIETDQLAKRYRPKFAAFFRDQKKLTMEKFKDYKFLFTEEYRALREASSPNEFLTSHDIDRMWADIDNLTTDQLWKLIAGIQGEGVLKGAAFSRSQFGTITPDSPTFSLANPRAVQWFQQNGGTLQYVKDIQNTTRDQLQAIITKSIDEGWSYGQTAKEISGKFDEFSRDRAQRIAVFESGNSYEAGNRMFVDGLVDDGIEMEEAWVTSHDEKVRPEHAANEAEGWQPLGHVFSSGDTEPPTDPGCRCYMMYRQAEKSSSD